MLSKDQVLTLIVGVVFISRTMDAQSIGSGSGAILQVTRCLDDGYTTCCPGRNETCVAGKPPMCYCDEYCIIVGGNDCCEDLISGELPCCKLQSIIALVTYLYVAF